MNVKVISPGQTLYDGPADAVHLPGVMGRFGRPLPLALGSSNVLARPAPIISVLTAGTVVCRNAQERTAFRVEGGFAEVSDGNVTVCVESATPVEQP